MNTSNIIDLPNEILLNIISKLSFIDVFYSLVDINKRFDQLSVDPVYIRHLDMTVMIMKSFFVDTFSLDNRIPSRICPNILPQIDSQSCPGRRLRTRYTVVYGFVYGEIRRNMKTVSDRIFPLYGRKSSYFSCIRS
jgi:hypothetical protein